MNAGGTLSPEIDLSDGVLVGLIGVGMAVGTLTFQVSAISETDPNNPSLAAYATVQGSDGTALSVTGNGTFAVDIDVMSKLAGYRFLKIKSSVTQTNGVRFYLPGRG